MANNTDDERAEALLDSLVSYDSDDSYGMPQDFTGDRDKVTALIRAIREETREQISSAVRQLLEELERRD